MFLFFPFCAKRRSESDSLSMKREEEALSAQMKEEKDEKEKSSRATIFFSARFASRKVEKFPRSHAHAHGHTSFLIRNYVEEKAGRRTEDSLKLDTRERERKTHKRKLLPRPPSSAFAIVNKSRKEYLSWSFNHVT